MQISKEQRNFLLKNVKIFFDKYGIFDNKRMIRSKMGHAREK